MKTTLYSILLLALSLSTFYSCNSKGKPEESSVKKTIDINGTNTAIKSAIGIDLLAYQKKIDHKFPEENFYLKVCEDILYNTGNSPIQTAFGRTLNYDNGDKIANDEAEDIFIKLCHCIGNNIYLDDCQGESQDSSFCSYKKRVKKSSLSVNGIEQLSPSGIYFDLLDRYESGYLNYNELAFMIIFYHVLNDLLYVENPEGHLQNEQL